MRVQIRLDSTGKVPVEGIEVHPSPMSVALDLLLEECPKARLNVVELGTVSAARGLQCTVYGVR
jgi:hypothetical protein